MTLLDQLPYDFSPEQEKFLGFLDDWFTVDLGLERKIKYQLPFYYRNSWICYLKPHANSVELAFTRGNELSNDQGLLESKGRKQVMSLEFTSLDDLAELPYRQIVHEAILLDEQVPYAPKRKSAPKGAGNQSKPLN